MIGDVTAGRVRAYGPKAVPAAGEAEFGAGVDHHRPALLVKWWLVVERRHPARQLLSGPGRRRPKALREC
jgi:hypothetical protein